MMPKLINVFSVIDRVTGSPKMLHIHLGTFVPIDARFNLHETAYTLIGLPIGVFGRGFEAKKVGVQLGGRLLDLARDADPLLSTFHAEQVPQLGLAMTPPHSHPSTRVGGR